MCEAPRRRCLIFQEIQISALVFFSNDLVCPIAAVDGLSLRCLGCFPLDGMLDRLKHVIDCRHRYEPWLGTFLENASANQDRVPCVLAQWRFVEFVGTSNIGLRGVANKVNSLWWQVDPVNVFPPLLQQPRCELECSHLGLPECRRLHVFASHGFEHGLQGGTESSHTKTSVVMRCSPDHIVVREEDGRSFIKGFGTSAQAPFLGHEQVQNDLLISGPIAAVREDKDSFYLCFPKITQPGIVLFIFGELSEGCCVDVVFDDISGGSDIFESIAFSDLATFLSLATNDKDGAIAFSHFPHWGVTTNKLPWRYFHMKLSTQV